MPSLTLALSRGAFYLEGMVGLQKYAMGLAVVAGLAFVARGPAADETGPPPGDDLDTLFAELAEPDQRDWQRIESEIVRRWSQSGSPAMDLLLQRGSEAMEKGNWQAAVEHLSALVDHAPDFAEAWNARATAFYMMGEYSLAIADIERVLALNPRHFGALSGLAIMFEAMDEKALALRAHRAAHAIHPHRPEVIRAIERLEHETGGAEL